MKFFNFLIQKKFYLHVLIAFVVSILLLWFVIFLLNSYTHHGEAISVPDYSGLRMSEIDSLPNEHSFNFIITDSIYDSKRLPGTIVMQNPLSYSKVKRKRKIYFTIIAKMPEMVKMPNLVDLSLRQALVTLDANGLNVDNLHYTPDFAENAVLAQIYNGDTISPDSLIQKGAKIDLILGKGYDPRKIKLPFLIGMSQKDVRRYLHRSSLNIGQEIILNRSEAGMYRVYKQQPSWNNDTSLNYGDFISLWYLSDINFNFDKYVDSLLKDTTIKEPILMPFDSLFFESANDSLFFEEI